MGERLTNTRHSSNSLDEIDELTKEINEESSEQKRISYSFNSAMSTFASDRSLETCLEALNMSIQMANIREKLVQLYQYYARLLEKEVIRLNKVISQKESNR